MKRAVVAPLGLSPPVITTFIHGFTHRISDLVLLHTENPEVVKGLELIKLVLGEEYPGIRIHSVPLPFDDVSSTEDNLRFMRIAGKAIRDEREKYRVESVVLNVSGGRKNMCITLTLLGQLLGVDGVFHVVTRDVKIFNIMLERLREEISRIYSAKTREEKLRIYRSREQEFRDLLFPPKDEFEIVRIPTLPYPRGYLSRLLNAVLSDLEMLSEEEREALAMHGVLEKTGRRYYLTDYGRRLVETLVKGEI